MSAELATLTQLIKKPSSVSTVTVEAVEDITKYSKVFINEQGKAVNSIIDIRPDAIYSTTEGGLFVSDEGATPIGGYYSYNTFSLSGDSYVDLGNGVYCKPYWYKSNAGYYIKLVVFSIDTATNSVNIKAVSSTFSTSVAGTSITYPSYTNYSTSICLIGDTFVVSCGYYDGTNYYGEVHEIIYDSVNTSFSTPSLKISDAGTSTNQSFYNNVYKYSDTQYVASVYDGANYNTGVRNLGTTSVTTFVGTAQNNSTLTTYNYKLLVFTNIIMKIYSNAIYYSVVDANGNLSTVVSLSISVDSAKGEYFNGSSAYLINSGFDANGDIFIAMFSYDKITTYKFNFDGTSLIEDTASRVTTNVNFVGTYYSQLYFGSIFTVTQGAKWLVSCVNYEYNSASSENGSNLTTNVYTLEFANGAYSITSMTNIDNAVKTSYIKTILYSDINGTFLYSDQSQLTDLDSSTYGTRVDKISTSGTTGQIQYSKEVNAIALDDIVAGTSGRVLAKSPVITDTSAVAGSILAENMIATSNGTLLEIK